MSSQGQDASPIISYAMILKILREKYPFIIVLTLAIFSAGMIITFLRTPIYQATAEIIIGKQYETSIEMGDDFMKDYRLLDSLIETELRVLKSAPLTKKTLDKLILDNKIPKPPANLSEDEIEGYYNSIVRDAFEYNRVPNSHVVLISASADSPELARDMANTVVDVYIETRLSSRFDRVKKSLDWLRGEVDSLKDKVVESEQGLLEFIEDNDKAFLTFDVSTEGEGSAPPEAAILEMLNEKKIQTELELAEKVDLYLDGHPEIVELRNRIARYEAKINETKDKLRRDHQLRIRYQMLQRESSMNNDFFSMLMREMKAKDIIGEIPESQVSVIQYAQQPKKPAKPNVKLDLILAFLIGLTISILATIIIESLDFSLRSEDEVELRLNSKLLASLPKTKKSGQAGARVVLYDYKKNRIESEGFRLLWSNIQFSMGAKPTNNIVITSAGSREGKSTIVSNLGVAAAGAGKRTLLIDLDLYKPVLGKAFSVDKEHLCINDYLFGSVDSLAEIVQTTEIENLMIAPSNPIKENPIEALHSAKFSKLLAEAFETYDQVFIDTPPTTLVADANIIASQVGAVVFVVQEKGVVFKSVKKSINQLKEISPNFIGVVYNKSTLTREHYYHYYNYRYGEYFKDDEKSDDRSASLIKLGNKKS